MARSCLVAENSTPARLKVLVEPRLALGKG